MDLGCTKKQAKAAFSEQYDKSVGYRIMDALRNHMQHRGEATKAYRTRAKLKGEKKTDRYGISDWISCWTWNPFAATSASKKVSSGKSNYLNWNREI